MTRSINDSHHRKPRSRGGDDSLRNLVKVPRFLHEAWHQLFLNGTPKDIARTINGTWLDPDYKFVVVTVEELSAVQEFLRQKRGGKHEV